MATTPFLIATLVVVTVPGVSYAVAANVHGTRPSTAAPLADGSHGFGSSSASGPGAKDQASSPSARISSAGRAFAGAGTNTGVSTSGAASPPGSTPGSGSAGPSTPGSTAVGSGPSNPPVAAGPAAPAAGPKTSTTAAPPPAPVSNPNQPQDQRLIFDDEFNSTLSSNWQVYNSPPTSRVPSLVSVSGGALHVSTTGISGSGLCLCGPAKPTTPYGRWDVRARMPYNSDHGVVILLWPNAENWPQGGEIDLAEQPNANDVQFTVHYTSANKQDIHLFPVNFAAWNTYSVEWTSSYIKYWINGNLMYTITSPSEIPTGAMHLGLQAGADNSNPSNTTQTMDVDWVHVYSS
jgi:hypothetical protein